MSLLVATRNLVSGLRRTLLPATFHLQNVANLHTTNVNCRKIPRPTEPKVWPKYNQIVYPPQKEGEPRRPAEITHYRANIKSSYKKMWYLAQMIRGMSVDEAIKQLKFHKRQVSTQLVEVIEEAIDMAVKDHNVEFRSNLWISESNVGKGMTIKGIRKHRGPRYGIVHYLYTHYFVRLREGKPPEHYYAPKDEPGTKKMQDFITNLRSRTIKHGL
ncbi:large ribosomal subunit protein uL22m-like [Tubulanus polymorphus]|uniref:large ribosomal subunit protein uL22m-like n=1 Tax=Tubulanus polymorphus TaxID=672921 RepID=UPI003DA4C505